MKQITPIFRYTFTNEFMDALHEFSKIHRYDDRHMFKDAWEDWSTSSDIHQLIENEIELLVAKGFVGDIKDKMYKSARYYFRKKSPMHIKKEKERKEYLGFSKNLLQSMNEHIINIIKENNKISPAKAYDDYCNKDEHKKLIVEEIQILKDNNIELKKGELVIKFKKTYKNRFFQTK